jgi:hypothetical protein
VLPIRAAPPENVAPAPLDAITTIGRLPMADAGGPYQVLRGATFQLDASASAATSSRIVRYEWGAAPCVVRR